MKALKIGKLSAFFSLVSIGILACLFLFPLQKHTRKIYDCFLFFNELEMLDVRLAEAYDKVDHFVLVESTETFQGNPKPLYFADNKDRYAPYLDKIIHVVVDEHFQTDDPWQREYYQRDQIMRGLKDCHRQDIVIVSDADEILKKSKIDDLPTHLKTAQILSCQQKMYMFYLNRPTRQMWNGSMVTTYARLQRLKPHILRKMRNLSPAKLKRFHIRKALSLPNMGWHFNSLGGYERYVTKLKAFSHTECKIPKNLEEMHQLLEITDNCTIDDTYPEYITQNLGKFDHFLDIHSAIN